MHKTILSTWPLFFGISMIMVGNGLQGTLLGVRATLEGFPTYAIGAIMSMYFVGYMAGSHFVPKLIEKVGHIRVFAALAAIASAAVLLHALFVAELSWGLIRVITGFSYAGLYIVIESWLNNAATNETRGKMMATYLVILYASMAAGQYLLGFADPKGMELFVVTSILVTTALLPVALSSRPAPKFEAPVKVSLREMFKTSPLGVYGVFAAGVGGACLFSIGPVYAAEAGFSLTQIANFMVAMIVGGVVMQYPIGWLSDRFDRRKVLICAAAASSAAALLAFALAAHGPFAVFFAMFLIGGTTLTIYGLCTSHTNDHLSPSQIVAASASLIMINGMGSVLGPLLSSSLMNAFGPAAFFGVLATVYGSLALFGIYRTMKRPGVAADQKTHFVAQVSPSTAMVMQQAEEHAEEVVNELKDKDNL